MTKQHAKAALLDKRPSTRCPTCQYFHAGMPGTQCPTCQEGREPTPLWGEPTQETLSALDASRPETPEQAEEAQGLLVRAPYELHLPARPLPARQTRCVLCAHPDHTVFDAALRSKTSTTILAAQYGHSTSTWSKHRKKCLGLPTPSHVERAQRAPRRQRPPTEAPLAFAAQVAAQIVTLEKECAVLNAQIVCLRHYLEAL